MASTGGYGVLARSKSRLNIGHIEFGACAFEHVLAQDNTQVTFLNDYTISGGATTHHHIFTGAIINCDNINVTLTGTPAFVNYFCGNGGGISSYRGSTFAGAATGMKYIVHSCGTIFNSGGPLPGSIAGNNVGGTYNNSIQSYGVPDATVAAANVIGEYSELVQAEGTIALTLRCGRANAGNGVLGSRRQLRHLGNDDV